MDNFFKDKILEYSGATEISDIELIQNLWSNYGEILRVFLVGSRYKSVVVKHVKLPAHGNNHPRGWNSDISHNRKVLSYQIECHWYEAWAGSCTQLSRIPNCLGISEYNDQFLIVLEDLNSSGYPLRKSSVTLEEAKLCIKWLANFHGTFLNKEPDNLWKKGTYWHIDTRPDELKILNDKRLKKSAFKIDEVLDSCKYKTFVHGDAKLANFCFSESTNMVAAVDFQYVGGGVGVKDLAYFVGSCFYEEECEKYEEEILDYYFSSLEESLNTINTDINFNELEMIWRELYYFAWTDFHRFLKGWSPGHWKINSYSERVSKKVLDSL